MTFYDGSTPEGVVHVDVGEPYHPRLRSAWKQAADNLGVDVIDHGVYGAYEGPRFETRAEIRLAALAGVTVVGMTGVPEVVLALEKDLPYASLSLVANPAAGQGTEPITVEDVQAVVADGATTVTRTLESSPVTGLMDSAVVDTVITGVRYVSRVMTLPVRRAGIAVRDGRIVAVGDAESSMRIDGSMRRIAWYCPA